MARTQFQPGASQDHYHDSLGVSETKRGLTIVGPFPVAWDTPGINEQVALTTLAAGTVVLKAWARITQPLTDSKVLIIGAGGAGALSNGDWWVVVRYANSNSLFADSGVWSDPTPQFLRVVTLFNAGYLVAYMESGTMQGGVDCYALIAEPS